MQHARNSGRPQPTQTGGGHSQRQDSSIDVSRIAFGDKIDPKLYSDIAEAAARAVGENAGRKNKPSQLRRFYDELVALQEKVGNEPERFARHLPFVQMLKAKVTLCAGP